MGPAQKHEKTQLSVKTLTAIGGFCSVMIGGIVGVVAWVHAEVTIPKILQRTQMQIDRAIDRHRVTRHPGSISDREWDQMIDRLESIENRLRK